MTSFLDRDYWNNRWIQQQTGWDMGSAQNGLVQYIAHHYPLDTKILIPGCGNAHEAEALHNLGFHQITVIDIAPEVCEVLRDKFIPTSIQVVEGDFFEHQDHYDLILEQTFFCALHPDLRPRYIQHMALLLQEKKGVLLGLLFSLPMPDGPPFGGSEVEYQELFLPHFELLLKNCDFSIPPRQDKEFFFIAQCKRGKLL